MPIAGNAQLTELAAKLVLMDFLNLQPLHPLVMLVLRIAFNARTKLLAINVLLVSDMMLQLKPVKLAQSLVVPLALLLWIPAMVALITKL